MINGIVTPEIVRAILTDESISNAVQDLKRRKKDEYDAYCKALDEEEAFCQLLTKSKKMPNGVPGRRMADSIIEELKEVFPDVVADIERSRVLARELMRD